MAGDKRKSIVLSSVDMATTAGAEGDVIGALQSLPGTTRVGESGRLFVKGGDSRESATYIDGNLVHVPYTSSAPNSSVRGRFSPFLFSGMMFSTGAYSAEYGQALSSVLSLQTHAIPPEDQLNVSVLSVGAELGGTRSWEKGSVTAQVAYQNLGPYMGLFPQYRRWEKEPESLNGSLSFRLKTPAQGMVKVFLNSTKSHLVTLQENLDEPGTDSRYGLVNGNHYVHVSWKGEPAKGLILQTGVSGTIDRNRISLDGQGMEQEFAGLHSKFLARYQVSDKIRVLSGVELFSREVGIGSPESTETGGARFQEHLAAGFLETEVYASTRLVARLGGRLEYSDLLKRYNAAPRLSAAYKTGDKSQFSLGYGWYFQDPSDELLLGGVRNGFERADHCTLNYLFQGEGRVMRTEVFLKTYRNLVRIPSMDSGLSGGLDQSGHGYARGFDLFWRDRQSIRNGEYWLSYSFIDASRLALDDPREATPTYASRHNLSLVYKHWVDRFRSYPGISVHFNSPRPYTDPNTGVFRGERTDSNRSLDVTWTWLPRQNLIVYFSASNLTGADQSYGRRYASHPDAAGVYRSAPILPTAKRFFILACFITLSRDGTINQLDKIN
ncbi:MAG: TonB-dependent receptor [Bacteroidales bacterium]